MSEGYPMEPCAGSAIGETTLTQRLADQEARLKQQLIDVQRARQILKENPTLAELHNLLVRIR